MTSLMWSIRSVHWIRLRSIMPSCRVMSSGPPIEPKDFGINFRIDPYRNKLDLETFNAHPRDKRVVFDDVHHDYYFDGSKIGTSVTKLVEKYFEIFNAEYVADRMIASSNWPRAGYIHQNTGAPYSKQEILDKWDKIGVFARNSGTWLHYNIERYFNNLDVSPTLKEMDKLYEFEKNILTRTGVTPYRTEWKIIGDKENIGGTVDFVGKKADGSFVLIDWKTTAKLKEKFTNAFGKTAGAPLSHLEDCEGQKFALQLNIYRLILEKYYGLKISEMRLVSFNYKEASYFSTVVHNMDDEIDLIFESTEDGNIGDVHDQDRNDEIAGFDTETEEELESLDNKEPDDDKLK